MGCDCMSEPVRVLMVNYKMQCAGIESFIMNMYRNIDRSKVQFDFLVHYRAPQFYDKEIEKLGGKIYRLSVREDNNFIKYFRDLKIFFEEHPEYKIVHGHMESFGVFYLRAAKLAGIPTRIAHSHIAQKNDGLKGTAKHILNRFYRTYATDLFACSDEAGKFLFGNRKYTVFNNAIDTKKFVFSPEERKRVRAELGVSEDDFIVGHVGRFNQQKNHMFLIDIFNEIQKKNEKAKLLLIGEGDLYNAVVKYANDLKIRDKILFMGIRADVNRIYQAMDVFVMPSLFEGLPVSGIEAQAAGLPCVFSDTITRQTAITPNVKFISLNDSKGSWAEKILDFSNSVVRTDMSKYIYEAGYDIGVEVSKLQNFYISRAKND